MRVVDQIPHERFKITTFLWNNKYTLKIELDQYEQSFKIDESEVEGTAGIRKMLTPEFLSKVLHNFLNMRAAFVEAHSSLK